MTNEKGTCIYCLRQLPSTEGDIFDKNHIDRTEEVFICNTRQNSPEFKAHLRE